MSGPTFDPGTGRWRLPEGEPAPPEPSRARSARRAPRRRWWVGAVVLAFALGTGVGGVTFGRTGAGGDRADPPPVVPAPAPVPTPAPGPAPVGVPRTYQLEVAISAGRLQVLGAVAWSTGRGIEYRRNVPTPWRTEVTIPADRPHDTAQVMGVLPVDPDGDDSITCTLRQDARTLATQTGHGSYATVSCASGP